MIGKRQQTKANEFFLGDELSSKKITNYVDLDGNVFILGEFDETISQNVVPNLLKKINDEIGKPDAQIWFYINSNGGYCHELYNLLSLIDMAKSQGIKIYTVVMGRAYSCGSMLAMHGDHRAIYKYGKHLMHLGKQGEDVTTYKQIERAEKKFTQHFDNIVEMYKKNTTMSEEKIREILSDDSYFMDAEECLENGLVDEIIGTPKPIQELEVKDGMELDINGLVVKLKVVKEFSKEFKAKNKIKGDDNGHKRKTKKNTLIL